MEAMASSAALRLSVNCSALDPTSWLVVVSYIVQGIERRE
jgi:hypothetical protein